MADGVQNAESGGLRPAEMEQGGLRKLRRGVIVYCVGELWSLVFGSCVLWFAGVLRHEAFTIALMPGGLYMGLTAGSQIETWLAMMTGEPVLSENGEIDSNSPFERGMWYLLPPLVAVFGMLSLIPRSLWVSVVTSAISLLLFARYMRRIRRIWKEYQAKLDAGEVPAA